MYSAPVPFPLSLMSHPDDLSSSTSKTILFVNGIRLDRPHSLHKDIITLGGGRYSYWGNSVLFSLPSNGDFSDTSVVLLRAFFNPPKVAYWALGCIMLLSLLSMLSFGISLKTLIHSGMLLCLAFIVFSLCGTLGLIQKTVVINKSNASPGIGHEIIVNPYFREHGIFFDSPKSKWLLYEEDVPLGPRTTDTRVVKKFGNGAYELGPLLKFSTTANNDFFNNNKEYTLRMPIIAKSRTLVIFSLLFTGLLFLSVSVPKETQITLRDGILYTSGLAFVLGLLLLFVSSVGFLLSTKDDALSLVKSYSQYDVTLSLEHFTEDVERTKKETDSKYATRLTKELEQVMSVTPLVRVPIWENYLLYAMSYIDEANYSHYQYFDYQRGLRRGAGDCGQHVIILLGLLQENGIQGDRVGLNGHIVAQITTESGNKLLLAPQFGVILPFGIDEAPSERETIVKVYLKRLKQLFPDSSSIAESLLNEIVDWYLTGDNTVYPIGDDEYISVGKKFEDRLYIIKFILPVLLIVQFFFVRRLLSR